MSKSNKKELEAKTRIEFLKKCILCNGLDKECPNFFMNGNKSRGLKNSDNRCLRWYVIANDRSKQLSGQENLTYEEIPEAHKEVIKEISPQYRPTD